MLTVKKLRKFRKLELPWWSSASTAGGTASVPGQRTKNSCASQTKKKIQKIIQEKIKITYNPSIPNYYCFATSFQPSSVYIEKSS